MNMKRIILGFILCAAVVAGIAATATKTPILRGILQSDLDGAGYAITNVIIDGSGITNFAGAAQTNNTIVAAGTNAVVLTNSAGGVTVYTVSSTATGSGTGQTNDTRIAPGANVTVTTNASGGVTLYTVASSATGGQTNWSVAAITNAGTAAYSNSSAFYLTSNPSNYITISDVPTARTNWSLSEITNAGTAAYSNANVFEPAGTAQNATNGLGTAAWKAVGYFDLAGAAQNATNGLGTAAWSASSAFDQSGAAQDATNGLGAAAWKALNYWDVAGTAQNATNGYAPTATNIGAYQAYLATNALNQSAFTGSVYSSNIVGAASEAAHSTNADIAVYVSTATLTNRVYGSNVTGAVSEASHATNSDSATYAGTATNATFLLTSVLTNRIYATNVVSGGQLPPGTVATNTAFLTNAFLKEDGVNRYWSFDGASLTNVPFSIFTNYAVGPTAFTNVNGFGYAMDTYGMTNYWEFATVASVGPVAILHSGIDTNTVITTNGGSFRGAILDLSASASAPASNQLVTAGWTRNLLTAANIPYYATTNVDTGATNVGTSQLVYKYESAIPLPSARSYAAAFLTNDGYLGAVITTNTFQELSGGVLVAPVVGWAGGTGTRSFTYKAELYVSSDKTNWYGDWSSGTITLGANTTNYTPLLVDVPRTVATNAAGFYLQRRLKITSITYGGSPSVWVLVGTNSLTGASDAAHISLPNPTSTAGNAYLAANQIFTGTNTFTQTIQGTATNANTATLASYVSGTLTNAISANGNIDATGTFTGNGSGLTNLNASNLASGTVSQARLPIMQFSGGANSGAGNLSSTTRYMALVGGANVSSTEANAANVIPTACTLTNLYVRVPSTIGAGTNVTFYLMTNGVQSLMTVSILANGTTAVQGSDTTHGVSIAAGTTTSLSYVGNNSTQASSASIFTWNFQWY